MQEEFGGKKKSLFLWGKLILLCLGKMLPHMQLNDNSPKKKFFWQSVMMTSPTRLS